MFNKALVALDLSPAELPLLDCLPALKKWGIRKLMLTHVIQFGYGHGAALAHEQDYVDWLEQCAVPLRRQGLEVDTEVRSSAEPAQEILNAADEAAADLIIIGSRGQNLLSRLFVGSVARAVIRNTTRPLLLEWIEPSETQTQARCDAVCTDTLAHIVFATDFSSHAQAAEQAVLALAPQAQKTGCIHVLSARDVTDSLRTEQQSKLNAIAANIESAGGTACSTLLTGKPSTEIARHAEKEDASLIVVGKHGQSWVASKLIGSTAARICEIAGRPVLMVP